MIDTQLNVNLKYQVFPVCPEDPPNVPNISGISFHPLHPDTSYVPKVDQVAPLTPVFVSINTRVVQAVETFKSNFLGEVYK